MNTLTASVVPPASGPSSTRLERGVCLGAYELVLPIAAGGMGQVWIAAKRGDFGFQRMFAVKVMREELAETPSFRRMFLDEAKLAARLRHTNVVEVLDLGEVAGRVYQAMALVDGDSLSGLLSLAAANDGARHVAPEIAGRIVVDVLRGLDAAHRLTGEDGRPLGLVHRDVSPQNILVGLDGVSKIADFGIAKVSGLLGEELTGPVGKRSYMAPEQLLDASIDARCDVFSTGVVLWELLTGQRATRIAERLLLGESIAHPASIRPDAHAGLAEVAVRAIAIDPSERFATADAMADAIEQCALRSGLALSTKRVEAWVSRLVGARVSQQREQARREFELSRFSGPRKEEGTATTPDALPVTELAPATEHPAIEVSAGGTRRGNAALRWAALAAVGVALLAASALGAVFARRAPSGASSISSVSVSAVASVSAAPPPIASAEPPAPALEPTPSATSVARPAVPSAAPRRPGVRPNPNPNPKASSPSLPYDNPYKR